MDEVTIFLRTALFTFDGPEAHLPVGVSAIEGVVTEEAKGGLVVTTSRLLDHRGRELATKELKLHLPWGKVDHLLLT